MLPVSLIATRASRIMMHDAVENDDLRVFDVEQLDHAATSDQNAVCIDPRYPHVVSTIPWRH
jgi:hypothetical protein